MPDGRVLLTDDYRKTALARAVPYAFYQDGGWWLPLDADPDSARIGLKLFPRLRAEAPELVARARLSGADHTPIDRATEHWRRTRDTWVRGAAEFDPWARVSEAARTHGITPHEFQRVDAQYAIDNLNVGRGAYLGWEMGMGKSVGACMIIDGWGANFVLVVCPNSAKHDPWAHELGRFCPWLKTIVVGNTKAARDDALDETHASLQAGEPTALVCHYEAVRLIEGTNKRGWKRFGRWDLLVSDEAHLYKNRTAKFTSACRRLDAVGRLNLSGSVMSGKAEDLFVPWQMFQPKRYRSQWRDWNDKYLDVITDGYNQRQIVGPKMHRLPDFRRELGEVLTVRRAVDWLDVPEPHRISRHVDMLPEQAAVYRKVADELMAELPDGGIIYATDGAPLRSALRQITAGVPMADCAGLLSAKHDAVMDDIQSAMDSQGVIFGWHKSTVYEVRRRCLESGISCGVVCGDFDTRHREREIDLFKRGGHQVLAATISTLSMAANLQNAGYVGMLEESDDPVLNEQAVGRVVRQGQLAHASVYHYRVAGSVDDLEVMANAISKQELRRLILGTA